MATSQRLELQLPDRNKIGVVLFLRLGILFSEPLKLHMVPLLLLRTHLPRWNEVLGDRRIVDFSVVMILFQTASLGSKQVFSNESATGPANNTWHYQGKRFVCRS